MAALAGRPGLRPPHVRARGHGCGSSALEAFNRCGATPAGNVGEPPRPAGI